MKKVFLDANVFLDFWLLCPAGFGEAEGILMAAERKQVVVYTSSALLLTVMYFLKKEGVTRQVIITMMDKILALVTFVSPNETTFRRGLYSGFTDLEDGVQYHTALQVSNLDCFITNNKKDFKMATAMLPVLTPKEFLNL